MSNEEKKWAEEDKRLIESFVREDWRKMSHARITVAICWKQTLQDIEGKFIAK